MKKWFGCICLFALCLLTGCGSEDKLLQYMDTKDLGMINTSSEAEKYNRQLDREDHLKWVYDKEEVDELVRLVQVVKEEAKKEGCSVSEETLFGEGGVELWMKHASQGIDPTRETMSRPGLYIEGDTKESVQKVCTAVEKAGYPGAASCIKSGRSVSRGVRFVYNCDELEEKISYSLDITISDYMGYYPESYRKIRDIFIESDYFVASIQCFGGEVNRIVAEKEDPKALFKEVMLQIDQEGKIVEMDAFADDLTQTKIKQETEREAMIELLTMLTGERNDVTTFINSFTQKSDTGTITKNYTWLNQKLWEGGCMLRVQ